MKTNLNRRMVVNTLSEGIVAILALLLCVPLVLILFFIFKNGWAAFSLDFFTQLPKPVGEVGGGISNAIIGTGILVLTAAVLSIPLGIFIGVFLHEYSQTKLSKCLRLCVQILQGIPSIVIGIIAYLWVVVPMGKFSALSGGVALAMMMLPIIALTTEETIKLIPHSIKEASLALGVPYYRTILKVILPTGMNGILTGVLLSISRVAGETAPLLFTAFGNPYMSHDILKPINSLPLLIFNYSTSPYEEWQRLGWGASLLLILIILCLSLLVKGVTRRR